MDIFLLRSQVVIYEFLLIRVSQFMQIQERGI
jgi:hypothetical protein